MDLFLYLVLFVFWLLFWSFSSVIIYRLKSWEWWILWGRSHCPKCNSVLKAIDLVPVFSWIASGAKCRYCKSKISSIYPFLELSTGILFWLVWYFLVDPNLIFSWNINEIIKLFFWLIVSFISIVYVFYDILFREIHEWVMLSWIVLWTVAIALESFSVLDIVTNISLWVQASNLDIALSLSVLIASIVWLYMIMLKWLSEIIDFLIIFIIFWMIFVLNSYISYPILALPAINALIWALIIFVFFFLQIVISRWAWLGSGDLRIAIFIWILLGYNLIAPWIFVTYLAWSIIWITYILYYKLKNKNKKVDTEIPFWPFLAIWFFVCIFMQDKILELLKIYF